MSNIGGIIKSIQNIMWQDTGLNGDAQRIEQLGWMMTAIHPLSLSNSTGKTGLVMTRV